MSVIDNHNQFTTVQTLDGRRIRVDNQSGEITEIAFDSLEIAPVAVLNPDNIGLPVLDVLQPPILANETTNIADIVRNKKFQSKF